MKKGSVLVGSNLSVNIGGHVYAGFESGPVTATFINDANGYLLENPYSQDPNAPKRMLMVADLAFDTAGSVAAGNADSRANGAFTQTLLHVPLVGTAIVDLSTGRLVVDAIGIVELNVLGLEQGYGVLSFHMESYADQDHAPAEPLQPDARPLELSAWVPGTDAAVADTQRPGDPIILAFNKPLAIDSISTNSLELWKNDQRINYDWKLEGTALVLTPTQGLQYSSSSQDVTYKVHYTSALTDLAGNGAVEQNLSFTMPVYSVNGAPVLTTTYPGFPCATTELDLAAKLQGYCVGGSNSDDRLPISILPANRAIQISFSQSMAASSLRLGQTVKVERCEAADSCSAPVAVDGELQLKPRALSFFPEQPWQVGQLYRYTLVTGNDNQCASTNVLCSNGARALKTALLQAPNASSGGPSLTTYFYGAVASTNVLQPLRNLPTADVDGDFALGAQEVRPVTATGAIKNSTQLEVINVDESMILQANVGCKAGQECPNEKYIYKTAGLVTDIQGYKSAEQIQQLVDTNVIPAAMVPAEVKNSAGAVLVHIYPTQLVTTSAAVHTKAAIIGEQVIATGTQVMRIRYQTDAAGQRTQPVTGWIVTKNGKPTFITKLDLYLDAPYMEPPLGMSHNLHSYTMPSLDLEGEVSFLADGRLNIEQISQKSLDIEVQVALNILVTTLHGSMTLQIPPGGIYLNYLSAPVEN